MRNNRRVRIVGGNDTKIETIPYQVHLQCHDGNSCGGSIISKYWVITAAHCLSSPSDSSVNERKCLIRAGSSYANSGGSVHPVINTIIHKLFKINDYNQMLNDIALLQVEMGFDFDRTRQSIELFNDRVQAQPGDLALVSGWGSNQLESASPSILQSVQLPIISKNDCKEAYNFQKGIPPHEICTRDPENRADACQGDSGGPLVINGRLAGIVSWGLGCSSYPGVYTEIAAYRKWIDKHVNPVTPKISVSSNCLSILNQILSTISNRIKKKLLFVCRLFFSSKLC